MKILYKPKMLGVECTRCGCIFVPKRSNLITGTNLVIRDKVVCPICKTLNSANFERKAKSSEEGTNNEICNRDSV